ncbi:hypothetical protein BDY19DRAFT_895338 [Irpex rosettiformis]|uniref:Uncharacterized protein n=1 Tax=Irpex rosettiformis TaxID=378272 RepID=A0ACB8TW27_9APHY|nr:hypothetical protein BDY19DRAFT_895338 [Irpex rosettiformis]
MKFLSIVSALLASAVAVSAAPVEHPARDVWTPKILYPRAGTVWYSGQRHNVTWDLSTKPAQITNNDGAFILLRSGEIETPVVVGHGFKLTDGRVEVTVPDVMTRDDFSLVLFGDSGNWGDQFTIKGVIDL